MKITKWNRIFFVSKTLSGHSYPQKVLAVLSIVSRDRNEWTALADHGSAFCYINCLRHTIIFNSDSFEIETLNIYLVVFRCENKIFFWSLPDLNLFNHFQFLFIFIFYFLYSYLLFMDICFHLHIIFLNMYACVPLVYYNLKSVISSNE